MPSYTTLTTGARTRILRVRGNEPASTITSLTNPDQAAALAQALTSYGTNLPGHVADQLSALDADLPEPTSWEYFGDDFASPRAWMSKPAATTTYDVSRRALAELDRPADAAVPYGLRTIRDAMAGQPNSVRRAVRDEVAEMLTPFNGTPVIAYAYDKWRDVSWSFIATSALALADEGLLRHSVSAGDFGYLIDVLANRGDVEVPGAVDQAAEGGVLYVDVHPQQLTAWLTANRPHLASLVVPA